MRTWVILWDWLTLRHRRNPPEGYTYKKTLGPLMTAMLIVAVVEGVVVELILVAVLPGTPWPWLSLFLHVYGLCWLAGQRASLSALPHQLTADALIVRDGVHDELRIPYDTISRIRAHTTSHTGRTGLIGVDTGAAVLAYGDSTVRLVLRPTGEIRRDRAAPITGLRSLDITVDEPAGFIAELSGRLVHS